MPPWPLSVPKRDATEYQDRHGVRVGTHSGVFVCGPLIPPGLGPCRAHSRQMGQSAGSDTQNIVKFCFYCKMFNVTNWVTSINKENSPRGSPPHETFFTGTSRRTGISSVAGQPLFLVGDHLSSPRLVAESLQCAEGLRPSPQRPQPTERLKHRLGHSLRSRLSKRFVVRLKEEATHKCTREQGSILGPESVQGSVLKSGCADGHRQFNSSSLHKEAGRNPLSRDVCSPVENHELVPSLQNDIMARHIPGCLNVIADSLSRANQIQSTEWSLNPHLFKWI